MKTWLMRLIAVLFMVSMIITPQAQLYAENDLSSPNESTLQTGGGSSEGEDGTTENTDSGDANNGDENSSDDQNPGNSDMDDTDNSSENPVDDQNDGGTDTGDANTDSETSENPDIDDPNTNSENDAEQGDSDPVSLGDDASRTDENDADEISGDNDLAELQNSDLNGNDDELITSNEDDGNESGEDESGPTMGILQQPAEDIVTFEEVRFFPFDAHVSIGLFSTGFPQPGSTLTISYPANLLFVDPAPVELFVVPNNFGPPMAVATAVAQNGTITITFIEVEPGDAEFSEEMFFFTNIGAVFSEAECDPDAGVYLTEDIEITFTTSLGDSFSSSFVNSTGRICNAAMPNKSGEWIPDYNGSPAIRWTADSGHMIDSAMIEDDGFGYFTFDCSTLVIEDVNDNAELNGGYGGEFCLDDGRIRFYAVGSPGDIVRVRFSIVAIPVTDVAPPYVNCVTVAAMAFQPLAAQSTGGYGGTACAEVSPPDLAESITKTVDMTTAEPGDVLTYSITAHTDAYHWRMITVTDTLPEGFVLDPTSVECLVQPHDEDAIAFGIGEDPCYTISGNVISVRAVAYLREGPPVNGPVTITLSFSGTIADDATFPLVNEACFERLTLREGTNVGSVDLEQNGAFICATAITALEQVDPETPTPPPTPTPPVDPSPEPTATETPDPTATTTPTIDPTVEPEPQPTKAVTGLPDTGNGNSTSGGNTLLVSALVASLMLAVAVTIRMKPRE